MNKMNKDINYTYLFILSSVSFLWFVFKDNTAYEWPAIDMIPFFERYYNNNLLINDYFTNATSNYPNPRWVFGYLIIMLTNLFNTNWYTITFFVKLLLVIFTPVLYYLVLYFIIGKFIVSDKLKNIQTVLLAAVLIVIYPRVSALFSIAWWPPYMIQSAPQSVSLFFGLFAIAIKEFNWGAKSNNFMSHLFFLFSTLLHPSVGLFVILFFLIVNFQLLKSNYKYFTAVFLIGFIIPVVIIKTFFAPSGTLDARKFVDIYSIQNHSSHYHLFHFGSLTSFSWIFSFILMFVLLVIPWFYFYYKKLTRCLILTSFFLISVILVVAMQYVFIDVYPSKILASIGPVRFTQFAYWMIVISWLIMFSNNLVLNKIYFNLKLKFIYLLMVTCYIVIGVLNIDSPKESIYQQDKELYTFISGTNEDCVFAAYYSNYRFNIPNIAKRAVFVGNGFPFNESYFVEYQQRNELLYGNRKQIDNFKGEWVGEKMSKFYRQIKPNEFLRMSNKYKLDYVLIEREFSSNFSDYKPRFQNRKLKIYKINDFKEKK